MKKITSTDVAKLAGVSRPTVSIVLSGNESVTISEPTKKRVLDAAKTLGYGVFDKSKPYISAKDQIAVLVPTLQNPYYTELLHILEELNSGYGYKTVICCTNKEEIKEEQFLSSLDLSSCKSVVYTFTPQSKKEIHKLCKKVPFCVIGELDETIDCLNIALDSKKAGSMAMEYLWKKGHVHIGFITNPINTYSIPRKIRLEGILEFAREKGISEHLIIMENDSDQNEIETGFELTKKLLSSDKQITALIAVNDYIALGCMNAIREAGLQMPKDISIIGFDHLPILQHYHPVITTVDHHIYDRASLAISMLLDDKRKSTSKKIIYEPTLIINET